MVARIARSILYSFSFFGFLVLLAGDLNNFQSLHILEAMLFSLLLGLFTINIVPVIVARYWAESSLRLFLFPFFLLSIPFLPLARFSRLLSRGVARMAGEEAEETPEQEFEDDIADSLDEATRDGVIGEGEKQMIASIIDIGDATAEDVMIPRTRMVCIDIQASVNDAITLANTHGHSRLPVYEANRDNVVGVFYVRDALHHWDKRSESPPAIKTIMREPTFVPESKNLLALIQEFQEKKTHLAIVIDEHGGTEGLITLEDLLEEIVGDIRDEFDSNEEDSPPSGRYHEVQDGVAEVDARIRVENLNEKFGCDLPESKDYGSLGGLISSRLGKIPAIGEEIPVDNVVLEVLEGTERVVQKVRVTRKQTKSQEAEMPPIGNS